MLTNQGLVKGRTVNQTDLFKTGQIFANTEGVIPAPKTCHAIKVGIDKALKCKKTGEENNILITFSGHGLLDLQGYSDFIEGNLIE